MKFFIFGENLRMLRQAKGISQEAMAKRLGISQAAYSRIERQSIIRDTDQICKIAKAFNLEPVALMLALEEFDAYTALSDDAAGLTYKLRMILNTRLGMVLMVGSGYAIVNAVYEGAKGACSAIGTSHSTMILVGFIAATIATFGIIYCIRSVKRSG